MENKLIWPEPGKYILALSGGVDSVVLFDLLKDKYDLVVAHINHGVRKEAEQDQELAESLAKQYGFAFELKKLDLEKFSEEKGRAERYNFFKELETKHQADGIITAHHKDDVIETALINLSRGTGHRGLVSLDDKEILRPLLNVDKAEIYHYAKANNLKWQEDITNKDVKYLRNFFRNLLKKKGSKVSSEIFDKIKTERELGSDISGLKAELIKDIVVTREPLEINRYKFLMLPHNVAKEIVRDLFDDLELDSKNIELIVRFIKVAKRGDKFSLGSQHFLLVTKDTVKYLKKG